MLGLQHAWGSHRYRRRLEQSFILIWNGSTSISWQSDFALFSASLRRRWGRGKLISSGLKYLGLCTVANVKVRKEFPQGFIWFWMNFLPFNGGKSSRQYLMQCEVRRHKQVCFPATLVYMKDSIPPSFSILQSPEISPSPSLANFSTKHQKLAEYGTITDSDL